MNAKISVIIPCYNQGRFLKEAVASVIAQTYSNWECIIINDGSNDNTEEVALDFAKSDHRIVYKAQKNTGLPGARNAALELCKGDYIQLLDADDAIHPEKMEKHLLEIQKKGFSTTDLVVSYSAFHYCHHENIYNTYPVSINCRFQTSNPLKEIIINWENKFSITPNAYFFSASIFSQMGIRFDEQIKTCEDIDCWIRIFSLHPHIIFLDQKLAYYRNTPGSMSKNTEKVWRGHVQVMEKHMKLSGKGTQMYHWTLFKKNEVLFRYRIFSKMDISYKFYFSKGILSYYWERLLSKLHL